MNNPWIAQQRAVFADEVAEHKTEIAAMLLSEGDALQTCEALLNRVKLMRASGYPFYTLMRMLHSGFYGPINRHGLWNLVTVVRNSGHLNRMYAAIDEAMAGSDTIQGFTDQGMRTDPNGWRTPRVDMGGNVFNDWDGGPGHIKAAAWRKRFETSALQAALIQLVTPSPPLEIDGVMGDETKKALEAFQSQNDLEVDGVYGPKTRVAINEKLAATVQGAPYANA